MIDWSICPAVARDPQRNAGSAVEYFNLPTNRVIDLGTQIEI